MVALAEAKVTPTTSDRIAAATGVPTDYSVKVLQMLARGNLVRAQRGRGGGFRLECDPAQTTLLQIINAIDPISRITSCPVGTPEERTQLCSLHQHLDQVLGNLQTQLQSVTLSDVLQAAPEHRLCHPAETPAPIA